METVDVLLIGLAIVGGTIGVYKMGYEKGRLDKVHEIADSIMGAAPITRPELPGAANDDY